MKIYISCALTHVPRNLFNSYSSFIHDLAKKLKEPGHDVKYALVDSDPQLAEMPEEDKPRLCYLWDRSMVETSDLLIAEASFPSTGLGIEMQLAEARNIPIIICLKDYRINKAEAITYETPNHETHLLQIGKGFVSLMALGLPSVYELIQYENSSSGIENILNATERLLK